MKLFLSLINKILIRFNCIIVNIDKYNEERLVSINKTLSHFLKFKPFFSNIPIIFDVGGHYGETVELYNKLYEKSIIHTFEPNAEFYKKLKLFCTNQTNENNKIFPHNIALGEKVEKKKYFEYSKTLYSGFYKLKKTANSNDHVIKKTFDFKTQSGDNFCKLNNINSIDILKINVQGYEPNVIRGFKQKLNNNKIKTIIVEFDYSHRYEKNVSISDLESLLAPYGYTLFDIPLLRKSNNDSFKVKHGYLLFTNKEMSKIK